MKNLPFFNCEFSLYKSLLPIAVILFMPSATLFAQPGNTGGDLTSEEVEVINLHEAVLEETVKVEPAPKLPELSSGEKNLIYNIPDRKVDLEYLPPKLRPLRMKAADDIEKGYNGFAKLGYGFPNSPYGEIGYQYVSENKYKVGGSIFHHSANNKKDLHQRFSNTHGQVDGTYYLQNDHAVDAKIGFNSNNIHYYGFNDEIVQPSRNQVQQQFNLFNIGSKFYSTKENRLGLNYGAELDIYGLKDNFTAKESSADLKVHGTKWIKEKHALKVGLRTDFGTYQDGPKQGLSNFFLSPSFTFHGNSFRVKGGLHLASSKDEFYLLPDVEASFNILGNNLALYAGAQGDLYKNNMRSLSDYNPFIATNGKLQIQNTKVNHYYLGLKGILSNLDYEASLGYKDAKGLALFVIDPADSLRFLPIYDDTEIFTIKGALNVELGKNLSATITAASNIYKTTTENEAFGLPSFEFNTGLRYKLLENKLFLRADVQVESGVWVKDEDSIEEKINGLLDVSLRGEYFFMKNIGAFVHLNNLTSNFRQRWYRYQSYGLNVIAGVSARF